MITQPADSVNSPAPLTLMTVHAHPDDEVVFTGGILALAPDQGVRTVLICCTGGEEGEIHDPDLDPEADHPRLGAIRAGELRCAVEKLGIDVLEMLGYPDSGMAGREPNANPSCFHQVPLEETTGRIVELIRRYQPQVLVTYNAWGAYGHPDHIKAHDSTMAAWDVAGDAAYRPDLGAPWTPLKLYYTSWNEEGFKQAREMYIERGLKWPFDRDEEEAAEAKATDETEAVSDEIAAEAEGTQAPDAPKEPEYQPPPVTTRIDVRAAAERRMAATRCHRTQFQPDGAFMNMPEDIALVVWGEEHYSLVRSRVEAPQPETDLFAGIRA
ncbi:MAG TPA: PIG-L family deacetylase [Chloroflexia bacterium]|nr:PIG-L family deacetylase [Chloroflexia bacterium]